MSNDAELEDFREACAIVSDIEVRLKDVPVLLRQYLDLGGKLLSFNIDKSFSGVMDGLIVADLLHGAKNAGALYGRRRRAAISCLSCRGGSGRRLSA